MSDLILDQFRRLLSSLPTLDPWPDLVASGFLDLLRSEEVGGAGLTLDAVFPLVEEAGRWPQFAAVVPSIIARIAAPDSLDVVDLQIVLTDAGWPEDQARALAATVDAGLMSGAMRRLLDMTIDYAVTRRQFGREIGKFQAIQHQIAAMAEEVAAARMAAQTAFRGLPTDLSLRCAAAAKARAGEASVLVCATAHAVHGAIGMSEEFPLHLLTRQLRRWRLAHGSEAFWNRRLGGWALSQTDGLAALARRL